MAAVEDASAPVVFGSSEPVSGVPLERLEEEMRSLASHLAAATCAFLVMVGEYDARGGWASWQALSCAHWLNWRCGVGMVAAREQVRVACRLRELPAIRGAFSGGALSYSKVRALTRVAHPAIDERLVELAQHSTAAQLERYCAGLRRGQDQHREDAGLLDGEDRSTAWRSLRWHRDDSGDLVLRARIPAGADAESFLAQLRDATLAEPADGEPLEDLECRRLDALLDLVAAGAQRDASLAAQPEIVVHVDSHPDPVHCPDDPGRCADDPGRCADAGDSEASSASADSAEAPEHHGDDRVRRWPIRLSNTTPISSTLLAQLSCDTGTRAITRTNCTHRCSHDSDRVGDCSGAHSDSDHGDGDHLDLGRHRRFPSRQLRRAIMRRDDGCCRFPGCTRRHRLQVHHSIHWEHGGPTDRHNLLLLCPAHHRAIHRDGWTIAGDATTATFHRPDGRTADHAPTLPGGTLAQLIDANHRHGRDIALDGAGSNWLGDHIGWDCFFAAFNEGRYAPPLD